MGVKVIFHQETDVVGGDYRQPTFGRQGYGGVQIVFFIPTAGADQFEIIAVWEMLLVKLQALIDQGLVATQQKLADVAHACTGKQDQPAAVFYQPVTIDHRACRAITTLIRPGD
ncbi:hypothetical protein D3C71_1955490 [compost metagenome]